jgi:hypothetical protein
MPQFAVDVLWPGHSVRDFRPQQLPESLPEAMHRHFHGTFSQVHREAISAGSGAFVAPDEALQFVEKARIIAGIFLTQTANACSISVKAQLCS